MTKEPLPEVNKPFYRALEDRHRGSRELIKNRLRVYLPYIDAVAAQHPGRLVLDAGCGRGEWLELLKDHHIPACGVDTDVDMLSACADLGLQVYPVDVLVHLQACADHSLLAVTGFHIAEHLPFDQLQDLFTQAWRVLEPGGLLILETPNPENLLVGAANFYIDPTHQRPLPAQLLSFLAEHHGFTSVKLLRLQEEPRLVQDNPVSLYDVLANVSPDYAVVAQKPAHAGPLSQACMADTGVSLVALASRYDQRLQAQLQSLQAQLQSLQVRVNEQLQATQAALQSADLAMSQNLHLTGAQQQLATDCQKLSASQLHLTAAQQQLASQQAAVFTSLSWRITAPLRWVSRLFGFRSGRRKP